MNAWDGKLSPATAQFAEAQAAALASNIVARLSGQPTQPFRYRPKGQLSSVGHNKAVAEIVGLKFSGFIAWLMWRGLYLLRMPTLARKTRLFLEWNWAMFFRPDISHFGYRAASGARRSDGRLGGFLWDVKLTHSQQPQAGPSCRSTHVGLGLRGLDGRRNI